MSIELKNTQRKKEEEKRPHQVLAGAYLAKDVLVFAYTKTV